MIENQPEEYFGSEQAPHLSSAYCYVITHDDGTQQFFTSSDRAIVLTNIPTAIVAAETATFQPSQIKHGGIGSNDRFEARAVQLSLDTDDTRLRRFFVVAAAVKLRAWIIRVSVETMTETIDFTRQAIVVESGILSKFAFSGQTIMTEVTPEPYYLDQSVPRYFCQRSCNHALYGTGCGLDRDDFSFATDIVSLDSADRTITVTGQKGGGAAADYFNAGMFYHDATGLYFSVAWSAFDGGNTKFKLGYWHPELTVASTLTAYAGCRHTVGDCTDKFDNAANFGGFPFVPNKNPVTNGVA